MSKEIYTLTGFNPRSRKIWSIKGSWNDIREKMDGEQAANERKLKKLAREYRGGYRLMVFALFTGLLYVNSLGVLGAVV